MARIAGIDLPKDKRIEIGLTYIYGIGRKSAQDILAQTGINPDTRVKDLTDAEEAKLREAIDHGYMVEGDLRRQTALDIKRLSEIGCYRGTRHRRGLPMRGEGEAGLRGGPAGDLYISITVRSHKLFTRKGSDLYITMDVPMTVAALGGDIQVPTLSGTVKYHIPEGTQPGTTFRLREQGIVRLNTTQKGDLMVKANIVIPKKLTAEQKDMIKKLADSLGDKVSEAKVGKKTIFDKVKDKWN